MILYLEEKLIKAHEDINKPYYNHSYDRYVRDVVCSKCGKQIGEQLKYTDENEFHFDNDNVALFAYCPYCGEKLYDRTEIISIIDDLYSQLSCADKYAKQENNSPVPSVFQIQNGHIRELVHKLENVLRGIGICK